MMPGPRTLDEFIAEYGERGLIVLKSILEEYLTPKGRAVLGDFSFQGLKKRMLSYGIRYNPAPLLRILEKNLGLIETTYKSSTQRWWRVIDINAIRAALGSNEETVDPGARLLRIQFYSLEPYSSIEKLKRLADKPSKLTSRERSWFREFVFETLPRITRFLEVSEDYEEQLFTERELARMIFELAERVSIRIGGRRDSELEANAFSGKVFETVRNEF